MNQADPYELVRASVAPSTLRAYRRDLARFISFCENSTISLSRWNEYDYALLCFINHMYHSNEGATRSVCLRAKNAIEFFCPEVRHTLILSTKALFGWERLVHTKSRECCPKQLMWGFAYQFIIQGNLEMAVATILSFDCYLRVEEAVSRKREDFIFAERPKEGNVGILILPSTKTKKNQSVTIRSMIVYHLLKRLLARNHSNQVSQFTDKEFRKSLHELQEDPIFDIPIHHITPHSFRYGGATHDFSHQILNFADVMERGRWDRAKTTKQYLQTGTNAQLLFKFGPRLRQFTQTVSQNLSRAFNVPDDEVDADIRGPTAAP